MQLVKRKPIPQTEFRFGSKKLQKKDTPTSSPEKPKSQSTSSSYGEGPISFKRFHRKPLEELKCTDPYLYNIFVKNPKTSK